MRVTIRTRGKCGLATVNAGATDTDFDWDAPRRVPSAAELEALAHAPPPAVTDLARDAKRERR